MSRQRVRITGLCLSLITALAPMVSVKAQPVTGQVIDRVIVSRQADCHLVTTSFTLPMQYIGHFPAGNGDALRIRLKPAIPPAGTRNAASSNESARLENVGRLPLEKVTYTGAADEATLLLQFARPVTYTVTQGKDFRHLEIRVRDSGADPGQPCPPSSVNSD